MRTTISLPPWVWLLAVSLTGAAIGAISFDSITNIYIRAAVGLLGGAGLGLTSFNDRTSIVVGWMVAAGFGTLTIAAASLFVAFSSTAGGGAWVVFVIVIAVMTVAIGPKGSE